MTFAIRCCKTKTEQKNVSTHKILFDGVYSVFTYNNNDYMFYDLNNYNEIDVECDGKEDMDVTCMKNGLNKYILIDAINRNVCIQCNNIKNLTIFYHYKGYKWGPGCSYMNAPLLGTKCFNHTDFEDVEDKLFVPRNPT